MDLAADRAAPTQASLAFAVIDREIVLEIAELAIGPDVIAQRRTTGGDCRLEHRTDRIGKPVGAIERSSRSARDRARRPVRRQARLPQRLADINVAEAGNETLVHQRR